MNWKKKNRLALKVVLLSTLSWLPLVGLLVSGYPMLASSDELLTIEPSVVTFQGDRRAQALTFTCSAQTAGIDTSSLMCISLQRKRPDHNDFRVISQVCVDEEQQEQSTAGFTPSSSYSSLNVVKNFSKEYSASIDVHGTLKVKKQDPLCTEGHFVYRCVIRQRIHLPEGIVSLTYAQDGVVGVVPVPSPHIYIDNGSDVALGQTLTLHCRSLKDFANVAQAATMKTWGLDKAVSVGWQVLEDDAWVDLPETSYTTSVFRDSCWVFNLVSLPLPRIASSRRFRCLAVSDGQILGVAYHDVIVPETTLTASSSSRKQQLSKIFEDSDKSQNGLFEDSNSTIRLIAAPISVFFFCLIFLTAVLALNCRNQSKKSAPGVQDAFIKSEDRSATVMERSSNEGSKERLTMSHGVIEVSADAIHADMDDVAHMDTLGLSSRTLFLHSSQSAWDVHATASLVSLASFDPATTPEPCVSIASYEAADCYASADKEIQGSTSSAAPPHGATLPLLQLIKGVNNMFIGPGTVQEDSLHK